MHGGIELGIAGTEVGLAKICSVKAQCSQALQPPI
jgi:hypothetical protein